MKGLFVVDFPSFIDTCENSSNIEIFKNNNDSVKCRHVSGRDRNGGEITITYLNGCQEKIPLNSSLYYCIAANSFFIYTEMDYWKIKICDKVSIEECIV